MRLLKIIPTVDPAYGGPVNGAFATARAMVRDRCETSFVTLDSPDAPWVKSCEFPVTALGPGALSIGWTPKLGRWIAANASQFDVAAIHGIWSWASVGGGRACKAAGLPYVLYTHGMLDPYFRQIKPIKHWVKQIFWLWQGPVLRDAHSVLFTAQAEADGARGSFIGPKWREKAVAYGTGGPPPGDPGPRMAAARQKIGLPDDASYVLFLSRLHPKKGADLLVAAFASAAADRPDLHLVLVGPDPDGMLPGLLAQGQAAGLKGRIHAPGPLSGDLKWGAFEAADLFALITHQENFGVVLAEALASGTPLITTDKTNIHAELAATGAALICTDTVESAAEALQRFLALPADELKRMRSRARDGFVQSFTIEAAARDLLAAVTAASEARR